MMVAYAFNVGIVTNAEMSMLVQQMAITKGRLSGFEYMRALLAMSAICLHSMLIAYGTETTAEVWTRVLEPLSLLIIPRFLALGNLLVAASLERFSSLATYKI